MKYILNGELISILSCLSLQHWWRDCLTRADLGASESELQQGAAVCLQAAWRSYRERRQYLQQKRAVLLIQTRWRRFLQRRERAAGLIQAVWRTHRQRHRFLQQRRAAVTLQAACRGRQARQR